MKANFLFSWLLFLIIVSCSKSEETPEIISPTPVNLVFPENNKECTEGEVVDANTNLINFQWEAGENTTAYEFFLEDMESNILHQESTTEMELEVTTTRGMTLRWYIKSESDATKETATSEVWSFYNAGEGVTMHAPFPAELLSPSQEKLFSGATTTVTLEWKGNDVDNDILEYEVHFGENNPPNNLESTISESIEINISSGKTYYWFVRTLDENNNSSNSSVFKFVVE